MIRALIVDDEKLVRKGIISIFPWKNFQIEIVGEASNGKVALEFLRENQVELIFVDLTMPVMNGFELMKQVKLQFPDIWMVVLTCHQDFDYIQDVLRLGAIDYIVKTQLDTEVIEELLMRITSRIHKDQDKHYYLLINMFATLDSSLDPKLEWDKPDSIFEVSLGTWLIRQVGRDEHFGEIQQWLNGQEGWIWLELQDVKDQSIPAICEKVRSLVLRKLFFIYKPGFKVGEVSLSNNSSTIIEYSAVEARWSEMDWIKEENEFNSLVQLTAELMPDSEKVSTAIDGVIRSWNSVVGANKRLDIPENSHLVTYWYEWVAWLEMIRIVIKDELEHIPYSHHSIVTVVKAIHYIRKTEDYSLNRDELAKRFLMSGSYFSQCFKNIMGETYSEYFLKQRLEKAAQYLMETDKPIYWIAEQIGFQDEKYFSKLFRSYYMHNPQDYREQVNSNARGKL